METKREIEMPYRIKIEPNYYTTTHNAPVARWMTDYYRGDIMVWETAAAAAAWIEELERESTAQYGCYECAHGEAGAPTYTVRRWRSASAANINRGLEATDRMKGDLR